MNTAETTTRTFVPSPQQQAYFDWLQGGRGSAIMEAVAGAGKTTTLIEGAERMVGSVTFVAFNNKIAREIGQKLSDRGYKPFGRDGKAAKTFHAIGFKMLRETYPHAPWARDPKDAQHLTDKKVLRICEQLIFEKQRRDLEGLESAVAGIVSMAKNRGIGIFCPLDDQREWSRMVEHFALDESLPEGKEDMTAQIIKMAQICLKRSSEVFMDIIDYDDMIYMPLLLKLRVKWQSDWVLIDEAQDTNPTRREIAKKMLRRGGRLVAVGDPHQAIYGFTGTDNDSLDQIAEEFGCTRLPLTVTYRCPKAVVRTARNFVDHITAHESAPEGTVGHYHYSEVLDNVQLGDAVLCRFNKYLVSLVFRLIRGGVAAKIEGRAIGQGLVKLATRWKSIKTLNALEAKLDEHHDKEVAKAKAKEDDRKIDELADRHETMKVLIERAREQGMSTVAELSTMIMGLFEDAERLGDTSKIVTLCSVHRSKGLEWERVHVLGLNEIMPARCSRPWQEEQELNLQYVAVTRAKRELFVVGGLN